MPTNTDIANRALSKIGGAGDQESGSGFIASIDGADRISARCKFLLPQVRRRVLGQLAKADTPPKEARVFTDLGAQSITTLKMGGWEYVFNVPANTIKVIRQIDEKFATVKLSVTDVITKYPFGIKFQGTTMKLFTNDLSNTAGNSAFIERVFDQKNVGTWSEELIDCIATLLAAELCPTVGAVNKERTRLLAEYKTVNLVNLKAFVQSQDDSYRRTKIGNYKGNRSDSLPSI